jgi:hypothetical protein
LDAFRAAAEYCSLPAFAWGVVRSGGISNSVVRSQTGLLGVIWPVELHPVTKIRAHKQNNDRDFGNSDMAWCVGNPDMLSNDAIAILQL